MNSDPGINELKISFTPIGVIHSPYATRFGTPRQSGLSKAAHARIELFPNGNLNGCLDGLGEFSHIWLLFIFHLNTNLNVRGKVHPPRLNGESRGVLATRSPHRPNPIGLSLVQLLEVTDWYLIVQGADLVDGTPIIDIKPYLVDTESVPDATSGWSQALTCQSLNVEFTAQAEQELAHLVPVAQQPQTRRLIVDTVSLDPRPIVYKNDDLGKYRKQHAVYLAGLDVHFEVQNQTAYILSIKIQTHVHTDTFA